MSVFLIDGKIVTDKTNICEMWAEHFEKLGTPSTNTNFDSAFLDRVSANVQEFVTSCKNAPFGDLNDPFTYEEVANVCSELKQEGFGCSHSLQTCTLCWNSAVELLVRALQ